MIGVSVKLSHKDIVQEFFELFKTAWEFARPETHYDVMICSLSDLSEKENADLVIVYSTEFPPDQTWANNAKIDCQTGRNLVFGRDRLPIYGSSLTFPGFSKDLVDEVTQAPAIFTIKEKEDQTVLWIGYDLWAEIEYLLLRGQPEQHAGIPTLEIHIELLRSILRNYNIAFPEVSPTPNGYKFIACLTHDVDHASIRAHKFDRTIIGFIYRATVQTVFQLLSGRKSIADCARNWAAVIRLPFSQLGLLPDMWNRLEDYADIEGGLPSTFFVVPRAGDPGRLRDGSPAPRMRAVRYAPSKISEQIRNLLRGGSEVALHGIDAWLAASDAKTESAQLQKAIGDEAVPISGVRMHWLYSDEASPKALDDAGFHYDSTSGYNRTIGYRSGTCQVYKPLGVQRLKELPLHIMDTALFFPEYMNCRPDEAKAKVRTFIENATRFGGVLTLNWHDRSIAPERLWHRVYADILAELKESGAWFATASQVVAWFERRRAFSFDSSSDRSNSADGLPGLALHEDRPPQKTELAEFSYC